MNTQDLEDLDVMSELELSLAVPGFVRVNGRLPSRAELRQMMRSGQDVAS
jgi:hypothetical protein